MSINRSLAEGQRLLLDGKPDEAARVLENELEHSPDHPHLLLYAGLARVEAELSRPVHAISSTVAPADGVREPETGEIEPTEIEPTEIEPTEIAAGGSGDLEALNGHRSAGIERICRAMAVSPDNHLLPVFYARALYDSGDIPGALVQCQVVLQAQPAHPGARSLQFLCLGETDPLAGLTGLALAGTPDDSEIAGRALCLAETALLPAEQPPRQDLWAEGREPWAAHPGLYSEFADAIPQQRSKAWLKRADWLTQETGTSERAITAAEAAMRAEPTDATRVGLAARYFEAGRYAEVEAALRHFMPDDPERNTWVGFSLYHLGHFEDALELLQRAEADSGMAQHALGLAYLVAGDRVQARRAFVRAARYDSAMAENRIARAYLHCRAEALRREPPTPAGEAMRSEQDVEAAVVPEGSLDG